MKLDSAQRLTDLYPDRHLNVFHPYGTHDLDYNVTRALISTLRWSRPSLTHAFLANVLEAPVTPGATFQFDLQACDFEDLDPATSKRKVILGISELGRIAEGLPELDETQRARMLELVRDGSGGRDERLARLRRFLDRPGLTDDELATLAHTCEELERGSLPDGWIFDPEGSICVLIEAKLTKLLDRMGLDRHAETWYGRRPKAEDLVITSWSKIAHFFAGQRDDDDPRTQFLVRQLVDYLDALGLAPFDGFKPYDFDYDHFVAALPKFRGWAEAVRLAAIAQGAPLGAACAPSAYGAGLAFGEATLAGELRFDLREGGLAVCLRLGAATVGALPGSAVVERLLAVTRGGIENPLAGLKLAGQGYRVRVERLAGYAGDVAESETYAQPFDPETFGEALDALRTQHPELPPARKRGHRGALAVEWWLPLDDALSGRDAVLKGGVRAVLDLVRVAERLSARCAKG